jgi:CheY-like chemotaxis protein
LARKILLADDSVTAQNMGRKILADAGYEVIAVNNGSAALKKIAELKPDLVILDVYMPGYSGLEVCQRLKESKETVRIPVLLCVGKLEPFKPEEAQRVRAEGYIVKPFEASELLSALSKLEDKVVPRAEPSKPGRFARAMAAAEEVGRGSRKEKGSEQSGWNSRIGFPHEKTEPEEKVADDSAIYNLMNRDLRTVVETAAEKKAENKNNKNKEEKRPPAGTAGETNLDVAGLALAGLPSDVTTAEVTAIVAAAARIQMAGDAAKHARQVPEGRSSEPRISETQISEIQVSETQISETQVSETQVSAATIQGSVEPSSDLVEDTLASTVHEEPKTEALEENKSDGVAAEAVAADAEPHLNADARVEETQDLPVTTVVATAESVVAVSAGGSRWTAVPVALEGEEATISLEQEMQKAYAAFAAAMGNSVGTPENSYSPQVVAPRELDAGISLTDILAELNALPVAESADSASVATTQPVEVATSESSYSPEAVPPVEAAASASAENSFSPEVAQVEAQVEAQAELSPTAEFAESTPSPVAESSDSAGVATTQPVEAATPENSYSPEAVRPTEEAASAENPHSPEVEQVEAQAELPPTAEFAEPNLSPVAESADSTGVATTQPVEVATPENSYAPEAVPPVEAAASASAEDSFSPEVAQVEAQDEAQAELPPTTEFAESNAAPAPVAESVGSEVADPAGPVGEEPVGQETVALEAQESQPEPEAEPAMAEAATASSNAFTPIVGGEEPVAESQPESETVKSTAAAWASWRQLRDIRKDGEGVQAQPKEFEVFESAPASARAVAAGAEQIAQEVSAASKGDLVDVASIVDSVLANLRPKLMEEIARRMAEKK